MSTIQLALLSHTNVGKTTLARTLLRKDIGAVMDRAHVTEVAESHVLMRTDAGDELVLCVEGEMTLHQEIDGAPRTVTLRAGEAVVNPPGVWHTADIDQPAAAVFITAGVGTENRARD